MQVHRRLLSTVPRYAEARQRIEDYAFRAKRGMLAARSGCTKIPVVVHVVWKTPEQNISREQIDSQIEVLNLDFRKRNADFGTTGTATPPFDKGRTTTHEIGHWLNLYHIWGDDGTGCSGSDFVDDTPNQGGPNYGKPTFPSVSCGNEPNGDMFMNFMDYVDDDTMVMFSEDQTSRMQSALDGPRSTIGASIPCSGPPGPKSFPKDPPKELPKDPPKDGPKDPPKEFPKEYPNDPPKPPLDPPKTIYEPPKSVVDPPKSFLEPPTGFPTQPGTPVMPGPQSAQYPFVMATGGATGVSGDQPRAQILQAYGQLLGQFAQLYQRGMLDAQGLAAWRQAWANYQQMGGS